LTALSTKPDVENLSIMMPTRAILEILIRAFLWLNKIPIQHPHQTNEWFPDVAIAYFFDGDGLGDLQADLPYQAAL
jgi:hypothetical protein